MLTLTSSTGPGTIKVSESPRSLIFIGPLGLSVDQQSFLSHPRLLDLGESENWRDKDDSRDRKQLHDDGTSRFKGGSVSSISSVFAIFLWANRSCRWCKNEIKIP